MPYIKDLFVAEAKNALNSRGAPSDEQVANAIKNYFEENPGSGGSTTETVTETGTVVFLPCKAGQEITVSGDSDGTVELVQHGKNFIPPIPDIVEKKRYYIFCK